MLKGILDAFFALFSAFASLLKLVIYPTVVIIILFVVMCIFWYSNFKRKGMVYPKHNYVRVREKPLLYQLIVQVPRRFIMDKFNREPNQFLERGIHMFCGEQGSGKSVSMVHFVNKLRKMYPLSKTISNMDIKGQTDELDHWDKLITYNNGKQGVIAVVDEIQNWFMSGKNNLPIEMLEVVTQNRKNCRILPCTAQVFTRVSKAIREQVTMVYNPHTFLGCFTVVIKRKPEFDSEGNVVKMKYKGMYSFVHTDELRDSFDTYKVIHTLAKEGFKEQPRLVAQQTVILADSLKK